MRFRSIQTCALRQQRATSFRLIRSFQVYGRKPLRKQIRRARSSRLRSEPRGNLLAHQPTKVKKMKDVFIAASVRTPIGKFGGTLKDWSAADIAVPVVEESLKRAGVDAALIDEVIIGNARQAGGGPNVARQISYRAGVPETVPAYTVNKACGSGLKAILLAAEQIMLGRAEAVVAG